MIMKRTFILLIYACLCALLGAQTLKPITWEVYGLTFKAPVGLIVEEETEDLLLLNNSQFYIEVHPLVTEEMEVEMKTLLEDIAEEDQISNRSEVETFELPHFQAAVLKGKMEDDFCCNVSLKSKETNDVFYISIVYNTKVKENVLEEMLKSFSIE